MARKDPGDAGRHSAADSTLTASPFLAEHYDTRYARALIWTASAALIAFFFWAANTPVYEMVNGQGTIRPEGLSQRVEHLEGGIVSRSLVAEGDVVEKGEPLIELDVSDLVAEKRKQDAKITRLDRNIAHYRTLLSLDLAAAADGDPQAVRDIEGAAGIGGGAGLALAEDIAFRRAQIGVIHRERELAETQIGTIEERKVRLGEELAIVREQHRRYLSTGDAMVIPLRELEALQREIIRLELSLDDADGERAVALKTIARTRSQEAEIIGDYRYDAAQRLADAEEQRAAAAETVAQIDDRLARSVLRAPVAGVIQELNVLGAGEVITPGEVVLSIVPSSGRAFAEIEVPADRIGGVSIGDEASLKVLTYDFTRYGDIDARVARISPSSFELEDGRSVFRVALAFETGGLVPLDGSDGELRPVTPGMTVVASVKSERRTVLAYLLKPLRIISDRAMTEA